MSLNIQAEGSAARAILDTLDGLGVAQRLTATGLTNAYVAAIRNRLFI